MGTLLQASSPGDTQVRAEGRAALDGPQVPAPRHLPGLTGVWLSLGPWPWNATHLSMGAWP